MKIKTLFKSYRVWIKGADARTGRPRNGLYPISVPAEDGSAVCWCLRGAALKCYSGSERESVFTRLVNSIEKLFPERVNLGDGHGYNNEGIVAEFNDDDKTRFVDVLAVVKHAKV